MVKCKDCPYFWRDEEAGEEHECCHYQWDDGYAPCELEDKSKETDDEE